MDLCPGLSESEGGGPSLPLALVRLSTSAAHQGKRAEKAAAEREDACGFGADSVYIDLVYRNRPPEKLTLAVMVSYSGCQEILHSFS